MIINLDANLHIVLSISRFQSFARFWITSIGDGSLNRMQSPLPMRKSSPQQPMHQLISPIGLR